MSMTGYDIEDAIVLNRFSLDRGMARVCVFKSFECAIERYSDGSSDVLLPIGRREMHDEMKDNNMKNTKDNTKNVGDNNINNAEDNIKKCW